MCPLLDLVRYNARLRSFLPAFLSDDDDDDELLLWYG